jgi:hypothetical protein
MMSCTTCTRKRHRNTTIATISQDNVRKAPIFVDAEMSVKVTAAAYGCTIAVIYVSIPYHIVNRSLNDTYTSY